MQRNWIHSFIAELLSGHHWESLAAAYDTMQLPNGWQWNFQALSPERCRLTTQNPIHGHS